jgi:hypothetical protein
MRGVIRNPQTGEERLLGTKDKDMPEALALRRLSQGGWRKMGEIDVPDLPEPFGNNADQFGNVREEGVTGFQTPNERGGKIPKGETVLPSSQR